MIGVDPGHVGIDEPRRDGDDRDAERPHFQPQAFQIDSHCCLAGAVGARSGQPPHAGHAGDAHQRASAGGLHGLQEGGKAVEDALHVHGQDAGKDGPILGLGGQCAHTDARVGNHDVRRTVLSHEAPADAGKPLVVGDVHRFADALHLRQVSGQFGQPVGATGQQQHRAARKAQGQLGGQRPPQAAGCARDDDASHRGRCGVVAAGRHQFTCRRLAGRARAGSAHPAPRWPARCCQPPTGWWCSGH